MSYTTAYYLAYLIGALDKLAWYACLGCLGGALYQFVRAYNLANSQDKEEVRAVIDWSDSGKYVWRSKILFFGAAPLLYVASVVLPDTMAAIQQFGFSQANPCMKSDERGVLEAGTSKNEVFYGTFRLQNGVSIMCRIDDMNGAGTVYQSTYHVGGGTRVSG